jgi:hypothetical protein
VGNDYLVSDGLNKYSVPYDLIGEKVNLRLTPNTVEIFFRDSRVAVPCPQQNISPGSSGKTGAYACGAPDVSGV